MADFYPVEFETCEISDKVDGVLVKAYTFEMIRVIRPFVLTNLACIGEVVYPSTFKGLEMNGGHAKLIKILLGHHNEMMVAVVVSVPKTVWADFKELGVQPRHLQFVIVDGMEEDSPTRLEWNQERSEKRIIQVADFVTFGNQLLEQSRNILELHCEEVFDMAVITARFGQDEAFSEIDTLLRPINISCAEQLVVHYARDFKLTENALMWHRKDLKELFSEYTLSQSYNVCLLKGVANLYFDMKGLGEPIYNDIELYEVKCYGEAFKRVHRAYKLPFGIPHIAKNLFSPRQHALGFCPRFSCKWDEIQRTVEAVHHEIGRIGTSMKSLSARCEVIVRINNPDDEDVVRIPEVVNDHPGMGVQNLVRCLRRVSTDRLKQHFEMNLLPFVNFLQDHIVERVHAEGAKFLHVLTPGEYFTCLAGEAIICYALYGNVAFRKGKEIRYPKWLCSSLGIGRSAYKNDDGFELCQWLFPIIIQETLEFKPLNHTVAETIKKLAKEQHFDGRIVRAIARLDLMLDEIDNGAVCEEEVKGQLRETAISLIYTAETSCIHYDRKRTFRKPVPDKLKYLSAQHRQSLENRKLMTTAEFIEHLFIHVESLRHHGFLLWIINIIQYILKDRFLLDQLKCVMRDLLEIKLLKKANVFTFPVHNDDYRPIRFWVVIPVAGIRELGGFGLHSLPEESRQEIYGLCQDYLPIGRKYEINVIERALNQFRLKYLRPFSDVLDQMWMFSD